MIPFKNFICIELFSCNSVQFSFLKWVKALIPHDIVATFLKWYLFVFN